MADDYANTSCQSLASWAASNGMSGTDSFFSHSDVSMSDYGTPGMPKVIVIGCSEHKVYYNENYTAAGIGDAIDEALADCTNTFVKENNSNRVQVDLFPNPTQNITNLSFQLKESSDVTIDVINIIGESVLQVASSNHSSGTHNIQFGTEQLDAGLYFLRIQSGMKSQVVKFSVAQ